ncbi:hypothetical protein K227x_51050 [Rubripirellula lacrimiformis]|uniref:Uncharacterized protein n=1 Tax=Rubripirellula lacrimiformis TaxID=1930273 RepID=A0A517NHS9_9BACT|nr:hypothetical protein [Rubripirellula lacrimiformis]QDT06689.1 hypothetical protein K227x_51050 [Rubripirellula lacrimiformis]
MKYVISNLYLVAFWLLSPLAIAQTTTWDGQHKTANVDVTVVYFVPQDRTPLPDWRQRVDYFCRRIEWFHQREFGVQSTLKTEVLSQPFVSEDATAKLRQGDANAIFFRTLGQVDRRLQFAQKESDRFRILLVLSDINWQPLDDFFRLKPDASGQFVFDGNLNGGQHFPGAAAGGSRAVYLADRGIGWGLVSGDGWRVPCRGSDCVVYHEGCGHTVGLPHPEPGNGSVMSMGQYRGWINESWLDKEQKSRLQWQPQEPPSNPQLELFTKFTAIPEPMVPVPGQSVQLKLTWPQHAKVKSLRVRVQTAIDAAWIEIPQSESVSAPATADLGSFDRATPVSYRIDAELDSGEQAELWGYFQVRSDPDVPPQPTQLSMDLNPSRDRTDATGDGVVPSVSKLSDETDLLSTMDLDSAWQNGKWTMAEGRLISPKAYGARIQLPASPPRHYRLCVIVEPLDPPTGLLLGQKMGDHRFAALLGYGAGEAAQSALENVDGQNVGNETTLGGQLFRQGRLSQIVVTVRDRHVQIDVDGQRVIDWTGESSRLSLGDYWATPDKTKLFLGAYDCRYRFHRVSVTPIR